MHSLLPAIVSLLFLGYGLYVLFVKGFSNVTTSFFALCITTFFWQFTWAVLFQAREPELAMLLIKFGYLLIIFLPTTLYHFLAEISGYAEERRLVYWSYSVAAVMAGFLLASDLFVSGYYKYFWGYYPKAGPLHVLHVLQTALVVTRGLYITYKQQRTAVLAQRVRLRFCLLSVAIYFFAAVDYLANYGFEFYPPGVVFIAVSLGIMAVAIIKYDLFADPMALAAAMAHEIRTPLTTIRMQASSIARYWPVLFEGYQQAVRHKIIVPRLHSRELAVLSDLSKSIEIEVNRSHAIVDLMLASSTMEYIDSTSFALHSAWNCVGEALNCYPFNPDMREQVKVSDAADFTFYGSDILLTNVLFNLLKNASYAIGAAGKGSIEISIHSCPAYNRIVFTDSGTGIPPQVLSHIFEPFYTAKPGIGTGIGLAFCKRVMKAFGGQIKCESELGRFTTFILDFPVVAQNN